MRGERLMPKRRNQQSPDPQAIAAFAGGADMASRPKPEEGSDFPWRDLAIRTDVERHVLVPLPEDYRSALKWLSGEGLIRSQRQFAASALSTEIDRLVNEATGSPVRPSEDT